MINFEMIVLTASAKYGNYCVAGIDVSSGQWRRLVTEDVQSHGALTRDDLKTADGREIRPLDQIRVRAAVPVPGRIQTENVEINRSHRLEFVRRVSLADVLRLHPSEERTCVFLNECHVMYTVAGLQHSLELMRVENLSAYVRQSGGKPKSKADFTLAGRRFEQFPITDRSFFIQQDEKRQIAHALVVFSIADDEWSREHGHYKYLAAIYDMDAADFRSNTAGALFWSEGDEDIQSTSEERPPVIQHPELGKLELLTTERDALILADGAGTREIPMEKLERDAGIHMQQEVRALLSARSEAARMAPQSRDVYKNNLAEVRRSVEAYYEILMKDPEKGRQIINGTLEEVDGNLLILSFRRKLGSLDALEFEIQGRQFDQSQLSIEDFDEKRLLLTLRIKSSCEGLSLEKGLPVKAISDLRFLTKYLKGWYNGNLDRIAFPPTPAMRCDFQYASLTPTDEQVQAIVRSMNAPLSYVWGAPGTGKTAFVLAISVYNCLKAGCRVGIFAPTNQALDMTLMNVLPLLQSTGISIDSHVLRLGMPTKMLADKYPRVCENRAARRLEEKLEQAKKVLRLKSTLRIGEQIRSAFPLFEEVLAVLEARRAIQLQIDAQEKENAKMLEEKQSILHKIAVYEREMKSLQKKMSKGSLRYFAILLTGRYEKVMRRYGDIQSSKGLAEMELGALLRRLGAIHDALERLKGERSKKTTEPLYQEIRRLVCVSRNMEALLDGLNDHNADQKYFSLRQTTEAAISNAAHQLMEYPDYAEMDGEQVGKLVQKLSEEIQHAQSRKKEVLLLAATLDGYVLNMMQTSGWINRFCFDHIFLDEAGYCALPKALPLLAQGCPLTMLGDHMQLMPVNEVRQQDQAQHSCLGWWNKSAIQIEEIFSGNAQTPLTLRSSLRISHRFNARFAGLLDEFVYKNGFTGCRQSGFGVKIVHVSAKTSDDLRNSSAAEADAVRIVSRYLQGKDFAVLTPYRNQEELIGKRCRELSPQGRLMTIHRSQGSEWETVVLSVVDSRPAFYTNSATEKGKRVINTAISRARKRLILVCNADSWGSYSNQLIGRLVRMGSRVNLCDLE